MSNKILQSILDEKINNFKFAFQTTSKNIFWNEEQHKLIHPGEYGTYRESICKDFLRMLIPHRLDLSTGFIINDNDQISTQCDIIVFDANSTPLIQNSERQRFFPVETITAIGEVKSNLSKADFKTALNKLAKNKQLREKIVTPTIIRREHNGEFDPKNYCYDNIFSFLICNKLDFDIKNICNDLNDFYDSSIEPWQKHNLILSIEDGLIAYCDKYDKTLMYPYIQNEGVLKNRIVIPNFNKTCHFNFFASYIFMGTSSTSIYYPDLTNYISDFTGGLNKDEQ